MDYGEGLLRRWSGWHWTMTFLTICFFFEMFVLFSELYWWKYYAQVPASLEGILAHDEYVKIRDHHLLHLTGKFISFLFRYSWHVIWLGYGGFQWACNRLAFYLRGERSEWVKATLGVGFLYFYLVVDKFIASNSVFGVLAEQIYIGILIVGFILVLGLDLCFLRWEHKQRSYVGYIIAHTVLLLVFAAASMMAFRVAGSPFRENPHADTVIEFCQKVGFNADRLYSVPSKLMNAMAGGFGPFQTIVIFESTLTLPKEQLLAVIAHEISHAQQQHFCLHVIYTLIILSVDMFWFWQFRKRNWYRSYLKLEEETPTISIIMTTYALAMTPVRICLLPIMGNMLSWAMEIMADRFAMKHGLGTELIRALSFMASKEGWTDLIHSPLYGLLYETHPPHNIRFTLLRSPIV